jgi:hypothetical protein
MDLAILVEEEEEEEVEGSSAVTETINDGQLFCLVQLINS